MLSDIFIPFISIALAELFDKSQLMIILLASRTKKHLLLFLGVMLAFLLVDGTAVLAGSFLTGLFSSAYIKIIAGLGFIIFGILSLKENTEAKEKPIMLKNPLLSGFGLIFLAEWGDKTQITSGLFATQYNPPLVFLGVMFALSLLSIFAIYFGKILSAKIKRGLINKISGSLFLILGLIYLFF